MLITQGTRIIIAGSRTFDDYKLLKDTFDKIVPHHENTIIVSGGARGADALGERLAKEYKLKTALFPAKWDEYGPGAGYIRNKEMAKYAKPDGMLLAFWDGKSPGTKHMIETAKRYGLGVVVIAF